MHGQGPVIEARLGAFYAPRARALELAQQLVAALDREIQCSLRRFPAAERLLQLVVDDVADQDEEPSRTPLEFSVGGFSVISSVEIEVPGLRS